MRAKISKLFRRSNRSKWIPWATPSEEFPAEQAHKSSANPQHEPKRNAFHSTPLPSPGESSAFRYTAHGRPWDNAHLGPKPRRTRSIHWGSALWVSPPESRPRTIRGIYGIEENWMAGCVFMAGAGTKEAKITDLNLCHTCLMANTGQLWS